LAQHVQYRPISAGQLVGQAVEGYRRLFRHLFVPTCVLILPALAAAGAIGTAMYVWLRDRHLITLPTGNSTTLRLSSSAVGKVELAVAGVGLILLLSMTLMSAVTAAVVAQGYIGAPLSWRHALRVAFRRLPSLLMAYVIVSLIFVVLSLPSLVVALAAGPSASQAALGTLNLVNLITSVVELYLGVAFVILSAVIVLEGVTARRAIGRTLALVRGRWWATLGTVVLVGIVQLVAFFALSVLFGLVFSALGAAGGSLVALGLCGLLLFPLYGVAATLIYFDLRNRHGGLDLADLAHQLGSQAPDPAAGSQTGARTWSAHEQAWGQQRPGPSGPGWAQAGGQPAGSEAPPERPEPRKDPGPDPGAATTRDPAAAGAPPLWPAVSPKPPARRPPARPDETEPADGVDEAP